MNQRPAKCSIVLRLVGSVLLLPGLALASPFAYVPNEKSGTVSVIDVANDSVVTDIKAGSKPRGLAIAGNRLYVSDQPANALVVIDLASRKPSGTVVLGESPEGVSASAAGDWIVAASEVSNAVSFIDVATGQKVFSVTTEGKNPEHAVFTPDGKLLLVSAEVDEIL